MRPLQLEMTAFGSYAEKTTVPFERLRHGLYLVTGDTGAGKTTIFDAITFALYGKASGSERSADMLHCDHVSKGIDTVVTLRFTQGGKAYTVTRTIHFAKKRGTDQFGDGQIDALLLEPEGKTAEGNKRVTERCEELLGLNADQFRKIIMLAQGEFREFLDADSDKKNEILGKLFDNAPYLYYEKLLAGARDTLRDRRAEQTVRLQSLMQTVFDCPSEIPEEEREGFLPGHPQLLENLAALLEREEQEALSLAQTRDSWSGRAAALHRCEAAAESTARAAAALGQTETELEALRQRLVRENQALTAAQADAEADTETQQELEELGVRIHALDEQLPRYRELTLLEAKQAQAQADLAAVRRQRATQEAELQTLSRELGQLRQTQSELDGAEAEALACRNQSESARATWEGLSELRSRREEIRREAQNLARERQSLDSMTREALTAVERHAELYRLFLAGQAGLLGEELHRELEKNGEAACPVCGSRLCRDHLTQLAQRPTETPDRKTMDAAKREADQKLAQEQAQHRTVEALQARLESRRADLAAEARRMLPECESWEQLNSEDYLETAIVGAEQTRREAEAQWRTARQRQQEYERCRRLVPVKEEQENRLRADIEARRAAEETSSAELHSLEGSVAERRMQLRHADEKAAAAEKAALEEKHRSLNELLRSHRDALEKRQRERDTCAGSLAEKEKSLAVRQEELAAARREEYDRQREAGLTEGNESLDAEALQTRSREVSAAFSAANEAWQRQEVLLQNHRRVYTQAGEARASLASSEKAWDRLNTLATLAIGSSGEGGKLSFDRYVMGAVFREILELANRRMERMSGGRYELVHKVGTERRNARAGLEIEVLDHNTGQRRGPGSLSGGESFFTSLALALGLSDVVQNRAGGKQMDALFIDEGFGTLSDDVLDKALEVLGQLTEGDRLVGIISHVDRLDESIPQKIRVHAGEHGSTLCLETL